MARRWTLREAAIKKRELERLYIRENRTIGEIAHLISRGQSTVYERLVRLGIPVLRSEKARYNNVRTDLHIPVTRSDALAEFIGVLLGDGHLTPTQVTVTLGSKDEYAGYVQALMGALFAVRPKKVTLVRGDYLIYLGSTQLVRWLLSMGLAFNKVKAQVGIPRWIFARTSFRRAVIRGLFDTDGSVYRLRSSCQISFCNRSRPLLHSVRRILVGLEFHPSRISGYNLYLTRRDDLKRFVREIGFGNQKHTRRFLQFMGASHSGNCTRL